MKKRIIAALMMMVMLISTFSATVLAADVPACGNLEASMAAEGEQVQIILRASGELTECQYTLEFNCDLQDVENNVTVAFSKDFTSFVTTNKGQKACGFVADSASKIAFGVIFANAVTFEEGEVGTVTIDSKAFPAGQAVSVTVYNGSEEVTTLNIVSDVASETPAPTDGPDASETPVPTDEPDASETPAPTDEPDASETPAPTDGPDASDAPTPTNDPNATPQPSFIYGDVDGDGEVKASDALMILKNVVNLTTFTADQKKAADVDNNGEIEAKDALNVLKKVVELIDKFPVEQ